MAAVLTGTPVAVTWAAGSDPSSQSITIPSDATAVYMFWTYYVGADGNGLASVTLNGNAPDQTFEVPTASVDKGAAGVAAWYNPATGSRTLDVAWDATPGEGPTTIVAFAKDGDTSAWRDADAKTEDGFNANSVTLTTVSGDLVIKLDEKYGASSLPSLSSGWTNGQTQTNNSHNARLQSISASGTTQVCASEDVNYSSVVAISIPAASGGSVTGTLASTLAGVTMASSGTVNDPGTLASTLAGATMAASGVAQYVGAIATTLAGVSMAAAGLADNRGSIASTLSGATMAAAGVVDTNDVDGSIASTLAGAAMAANGSIEVRGLLASALGGTSMAAAGQVGIDVTSTLASTLGGAGMAASGFIGTPPPPAAGRFIQRRRAPRHHIGIA